MPLAVLAAAAAVAAMPRVAVTATDDAAGWRRIGVAVGRSAAARIAASFSADALLQSIARYATNSSGCALFAALSEYQNRTYPLGFAMLEGVAEGASQPLSTVLATNFRQELSEAMAVENGHTQASKLSDACSDVFIAQGNGTLLFAHNEDYDVFMYEGMTWLDATLTSASGLRLWGFSAPTYPGMLPGWGAFHNTHGIAGTFNVLFPKVAAAAAPSGNLATVAFVGYDVLRSQSLAEAIGRATPPSLRFGQNMNIGSVAEQLLATVETAPAATAGRRGPLRWRCALVAAGEAD
eukprot:TRINITY_DN15455_c0_g1_i2.p1 TRINITY_DN15455_c0_g1~~TRINITY_DN15455_c0_g1_i2.p1  ORF type:complete len:312 (+),score=84.93 TRINITY_DN15455_c0_g1_i2:56-937(+)